ncbi:MAG: RNA polymerase subunit sigma, partial [Gammaproteobacteria bacterium]|nr:RNA polymerase subunit sigma [Gammaproteobacteria bacterium]
AGDGADEDLLDRLFRNDGSWMSQPGAWDDPERSLEQEGFWVVLEACVQAVPGLAGKAFILRELVGMEADEVCKELTLTRSNYWVLMHRARLRLRQCLDQRWFASEERESRP